MVRKLSYLGAIYLLVLSFLLMNTTQTQAISNTYYVSQNEGSDITGDGSLNNPWKTIQKAADQMIAGDTCIIKAGTYRETIVVPNSGNQDNPITFKAEDGENVSIKGTELITGTWQNYTGNIYSLDNVTMNLETGDQLFVDGKMMMEARWPNASFTESKGYGRFDLSSYATMDSVTSTYIYDGAMPNVDWTGATMVLWNKWMHWSSQITSSNNRTIHFENHAEDNTHPEAGKRYYIVRHLAALDTAGEYYYDNSNNKLYLYAPDGQDPTGKTIEAKARKVAFQLDGKDYITIRNLKIEAATITMNGSNYCVIDGINAKYVSHEIKSEEGYVSQNSTGIYVNGDYNVIKNSEIEWSSGNGVRIRGGYNQVVNNYIKNCNYAGVYASNCQIDRSHHTLISYNTLQRSGRSLLDYYFAHTVLIEYNDLSEALLLSVDGGVAYTVKTDGRNSEWRYNRIHNCKNNSTNGMYWDNSSSNYIGHHNTIYDMQAQTVNGGGRVLLNLPNEYNLFYDNMVDGYIMNTWGYKFTSDTYGNRITNNVATLGVNAVGNATVLGNTTTGFDVNKYGSTAGHDFANPPSPWPTLSFSEPLHRNRIYNSGFEDISDTAIYMAGSLDGWTLTGAQNAVPETCDNSAPLSQEYEPNFHDNKKTRNAYGSAKLGAGKNGIEQIISGLTPNTVYKFSVWVRVANGETVRVGAKDFGGAEVYQDNGGTNYGWVQKIVSFTTGASNTSATVYINRVSTGSGNCYADDAGVIYVDSAPVFNSNLSGWTTVSGVWDNTSSGKQGNMSGADGFILANESATDFTYEADINVKNGRAGALIFRSGNDPTTQSYVLTLDTANGGSVKLFKFPYAVISTHNRTISNGESYHVKVVTQGSNIKVYFNNESTPVIDVNDNAYTSGRFGLNIYDSTAVFQNVYTDVVSEPQVTVDDRDTSISYSGTKGTWSDTTSGYYDNTISFTNANGAYTEFTFTGTEITWISLKNHDLGIAEVYVDNVLQATIDCYNSTPQVQEALFGLTGLSDSQHIIKIVQTDQKNSSSSNYRIVTDAFQYR